MRDVFNFTPILKFNKNGYIEFKDIAADESIFRRLINYKEIVNSNTRVLLGCWHLSKDMCGVLISLFSGFGIFNLAAALGAKYLVIFKNVLITVLHQEHWI